MNRKEMHKIVFSLYCVFCLILVFFMNFGYGYVVETLPTTPFGDIIEERFFYSVPLRELLLKDDVKVFDTTTAQIRENIPGATIFLWISISLIILAIVLSIINILTEKSYLSFICSICLFIAFFLFMPIPAFYHRVKGVAEGFVRYLMYPLSQVIAGLVSSIIVAIFEGRKCFGGK